VHRSLSELAPLFEDLRYSKFLLLGSDLNIWTGRSIPGAPQLDRHQVVWNGSAVPLSPPDERFAWVSGVGRGTARRGDLPKIRATASA
jgi:hypothetical protein